jgi:hypothetical protein
MDGESLNAVVDVDVVATDLDDSAADDEVDLVAVVPPSKSSFTYRDIDIKHVRYMIRPEASNPTCSNNDLASVTSSYKA